MILCVADVESFGLWLTKTCQSTDSGTNERI